jgi:transposase-like protein
MTKFSPELAGSICDFLAGRSVVQEACRAHGISNSTFWSWVASSRKEPPELPEFEWMSMTAPFYRHLQNAKRLYANAILETAMQRAHHGSERRIYFQGMEKFAVRTDIPPDITDLDILEMLYDQRDRLKRDEHGHLVHLVEKIDPPVALTLAVLAANFEAFQNHSSQTIEVTNKNEMGVKIIGRPKPVQIEHTPIEEKIPATLIPTEPIQSTSEVPMAEDFSSGAEMPVSVTLQTPEPDRVKASVFYKEPPAGSSKIPEGRVPVFAAEAPTDDPPEIIGADTEAAAPADPPPAVRAPMPDVMLHVSVRAAMLKLHKGERASGAVEQQIMNALKLNLTPEQRIRRLQELVGSYRDAEARSEGLGAGSRPSNAPVRVV